jgi:hypothetical protein
MKVTILIMSLFIVSTSFAKEVKTDCVAMNEVTRVKVVQSKKPVSQNIKSTAAQ